MASAFDKIKEVFVNPFVSCGISEIDEIAKKHPLVRSRLRKAMQSGKPIIEEELFKGTEYANLFRKQKKTHALKYARWGEANKVEHIYIYESGDPPDNSVDCKYLIGDIKSLGYWKHNFKSEIIGDHFKKGRTVWDVEDAEKQKLIPCTCRLRKIGEFHWSDQTFRWVDKTYLAYENDKDKLIEEWELDFTKS